MTTQEFGLRLFFLIALGWLAIAQALCFLGQDPFSAKILRAQWTFGLWFLSVLDLFTLAKTVQAMLAIATNMGEKKTAYSIRALYWGLFKVVCLGLFGMILLKGHHIPLYGLILGMGTLGIVPLAGGFFWSQRLLRNA